MPRGKRLPESLRSDQPFAHPRVPSDPGGPGFFRSAPQNADTLAGFDDNPELFTHPMAPVKLDAQPGGPATQLDASADAKEVKVAPLPPPATKEEVKDVFVETTDKHEINVKIEVFKDGKFDQKDVAETKFDGKPVAITFPTANYEFVEGVKKIKSLTGKFMLKGNIKVKTLYGPNAAATDLSHYGRGTTEEDKKSGNVTLGFHEHCHRMDFLKFSVDKKGKIPKFSIAVGDTEDDYNNAVQTWNEDWVAWLKEVDDASFQATDEVGYTYSQLEADAGG